MSRFARIITGAAAAAAVVVAGGLASAGSVSVGELVAAWRRGYVPATRVAASPRGAEIAAAARAQVGVTLGYDPGYVGIAYPYGDVSLETGVCSDVVIRALRPVGIDLQQRVHEDMRAHFDAYPRLWRTRGPDRNIDHRRVANLMVYLRRHAAVLSLDDAGSYQAGDIVVWLLPSQRLHIGVVADEREGERPLVVHNIGAGAAVEDVLFVWPVLAHFRVLVAAAAAGN